MPAPADQLNSDDGALECVVCDVPAHRPGFYTHGFRTFYVATDGAIYLVRAPGQRATLQQLDDLPSGSEAGEVEVDPMLRHLAAAAEAAGCVAAPRVVEGRTHLTERTSR